MPNLLTRYWCWDGRNRELHRRWHFVCALAAAFLISSRCNSVAAADGESWLPAVPKGVELSPPELPVTGTRQVGPLYQEKLLQVDINQQQLNQTVIVLEDRDGALYLWSQDLLRWRFRLPAARSATVYQGQSYFALAALSDVTHHYDPVEMSLQIEVRPEAFATSTRTGAADKLPTATRPTPGGFFNYDLQLAHSPEATQRAGQFELGVFNHYGVGITTVLADRLGSQTQLTRLDSSWSVDFPAQMRTLHLGDAANVPGSWGRSLRFGGIQYGSNFSTQPGFVSFPAQSASGQAVLPSTVDVFVNQALVSRQSVPPGPFAISNLPVITGAGEVQLVVRDLLGREQIITQPFYGSQALLGKGIEDFSWELGRVRENFGLQSGDYGPWLASGTYRRGLSDRLTGELHAEAMSGQTTLGLGADTLLPRLGTLNAYAAASQSRTGRGALLLLGFDRQAPRWSFAARTQRNSANFAQLGLPESQPAVVQVSSVNLSYAAAGGGSLGIALIEQRNRPPFDAAAAASPGAVARGRLASLSYSVSLGSFAALTLSAVRSLFGAPSTSVYALISMPLDARSHVSLSAQSSGGTKAASSSQFTTTLQHNLPSDEGLGYRLQARSGGAAEAALELQNRFGNYVAEVAQSAGSSSTRLGASGGVAVLGGDLFVSRRIDQSFAVVHIPDYPGVRILTDNQPAGRGDASGRALIPHLRAYDRNLITLDQHDLPMDAEIGSLKLEVVPYFRSGVTLKFPIKRARGATFTVQLEDGSPLPVGASVRQIGSDAVYTTGYDGAVYVAGLGATARLRAAWLDQQCEFELAMPGGTEPLPDLGTFICRGVAP